MGLLVDKRTAKRGGSFHRHQQVRAHRGVYLGDLPPLGTLLDTVVHALARIA